MFTTGYKLKNIKPGISGKFVLLPGLIALALFAPERSSGQGNLLISPRRIVFDGDKKTQELNLANTGQDTAKYLISLVEIRMSEDGAFEEIKEPDPGQNFASKYLRYYPRSVTLAPNEAQTVKVQLTKTGEMVPGEYRSHIYFRAVRTTAPLGETTASKDSGISVKLTPVFGITIPVIIRAGESNTQVNLSDIRFKMTGDTMPQISMAINRTGNMSAYGDIVVEYVSPSGTATEVGTARGVAIYTPNALRRFQFNLNKNAGVNYKGGKLHVSYLAQAEGKQSTSRSQVIAEQYVTLP
ncbi:hypothetical protein [Polluticoccus soli]|uniref:hypothetical protein n=1 Tax=Polluticoccus soli TaxID=3034150 RepID=UPI0023E225DE|nr:hypothetical protein [Flavipsychrobacter sp. JY13-12]